MANGSFRDRVGSVDPNDHLSHVEGIERRIRGRKTEAQRELGSGTIPDGAERGFNATKKFEFTIGEDGYYKLSDDPSKSRVGRIQNFSTGISDRVFGKKYLDLSHEQQTFVDNITLIIAKQFGMHMDHMNVGDKFHFDFTKDVATFRFEGAAGERLSGDLKLTNGYEATAQATHDRLEEFERTVDGSKSPLEVALTIGGEGNLFAALSTLRQKFSFEDRVRMITDSEIVDGPDTDLIDGINKYLRVYFERIRGLRGDELDTAIQRNEINRENGEGYRGSNAQNMAWVMWIRYDIFDRDGEFKALDGAPPSSKTTKAATETSSASASEDVPASTKRADAITHESVPEDVSVGRAAGTGTGVDAVTEGLPQSELGVVALLNQIPGYDPRNFSIAGQQMTCNEGEGYSHCSTADGNFKIHFDGNEDGSVDVTVHSNGTVNTMEDPSVRQIKQMAREAFPRKQAERKKQDDAEAAPPSSTVEPVQEPSPATKEIAETPDSTEEPSSSTTFGGEGLVETKDENQFVAADGKFKVINNGDGTLTVLPTVKGASPIVVEDKTDEDAVAEAFAAARAAHEIDEHETRPPSALERRKQGVADKLAELGVEEDGHLELDGLALSCEEKGAGRTECRTADGQSGLNIIGEQDGTARVIATGPNGTKRIDDATAEEAAATIKDLTPEPEETAEVPETERSIDQNDLGPYLTEEAFLTALEEGTTYFYRSEHADRIEFKRWKFKLKKDGEGYSLELSHDLRITDSEGHEHRVAGASTVKIQKAEDANTVLHAIVAGRLNDGIAANWFKDVEETPIDPKEESIALVTEALGRKTERIDGADGSVKFVSPTSPAPISVREDGSIEIGERVLDEPTRQELVQVILDERREKREEIREQSAIEKKVRGLSGLSSIDLQHYISSDLGTYESQILELLELSIQGEVMDDGTVQLIGQTRILTPDRHHYPFKFSYNADTLPTELELLKRIATEDLRAGESLIDWLNAAQDDFDRFGDLPAKVFKTAQEQFRGTIGLLGINLDDLQAGADIFGTHFEFSNIQTNGVDHWGRPARVSDTEIHSIDRREILDKNVRIVLKNSELGLYLYINPSGSVEYSGRQGAVAGTLESPSEEELGKIFRRAERAMRGQREKN